MICSNRKIYRNVKAAELAAWLLYVLFWSTFFYFVLELSFHPKNKLTYVYINLIDAVLKVLFTIPLWWLFVIKLANVPLRIKLLLHIPALTVFCYVWVHVYGFTITRLCLTVFDVSTSMWDVYITALFYCGEFAVFHGYNYWLRTKRQHIREQELMELSHRSEIRALKAQIEPHFLFNTLNSISASVPPSLEEARVLIAKLADTFRYALKVSERSAVPLEEEIGFVRTWLSLEKHRFGERLKLVYDIDPQTLSTPVPPMILQPLLENALNHGISPLVNGGTVTVSCQQEDEFVRISISDTGVGYDGPLTDLYHKGVGLSNTSKRLELLFGEPLNISRNTTGLRITFRIPVSESAREQALFYSSTNLSGSRSGRVSSEQ